MVETTGGHSDKTGHCAVGIMPEAFSLRAKVVLPGPAEHADATDLCRGFARNPIAFFEALDAISQLGDEAGKLVSKDHRNPGLVAEQVSPHVNIASTD